MSLRGLLFLLLASLCAPSSAVVLFRCPMCTSERLAACSAAPRPACAELVTSNGCGCCPVCALKEGEACGVYTARCAAGLRCYPIPGTEHPLAALLYGQGACAKKSDTPEYGGSQERMTDAPDERSDSMLMDNNLDAGPMGTDHFPKRPIRPQVKEDAVNRGRASEQHRSKVNKVNDEKKNLRPPAQRSLCQQQLEVAIERILSMDFPEEHGTLEHLNALDLPNCDKTGLFKLKQCKIYLNGQRGECWCVNPNTGKAIAGAPVIRGDPKCHLYYPNTEEERKQRAQ